MAPSRGNGGNLQFAAVAISSAGDPCSTPICAAVTTCAENCQTVELDTVGNLDWMHAGVVSSPRPKPSPPLVHTSCSVPKPLVELGHLQIEGPSSSNETATWLTAMKTVRFSIAFSVLRG